MEGFCPLNGDCLQSSVVYGCKITSNSTAVDSPHFISLTENAFKDYINKDYRLYKQNNSFKCETKKNSTKLSNYVWDKKKDKHEILFKWYMKEIAKAYSPVTKRLMFCRSKKFHISFSKEKLLNIQNKIILKCRLGNKHKLGNYKIDLIKKNVI